MQSVSAKMRGIDPAYADVPAAKVAEYQYYIDKVLAAIDIQTQTAWSMSHQFNKEQFRRDEVVMAEIILGEAAKQGLSPRVLQVMLHQYFFADVHSREADRKQWANRVLHRKQLDYFPDASSMDELLDRITQSSS